jgi:hypothetical protein
LGSQKHQIKNAAFLAIPDPAWLSGTLRRAAWTCNCLITPEHVFWSSSVMVKRVNAFYAKVFYCLERIDFTEPHSGK